MNESLAWVHKLTLFLAEPSEHGNTSAFIGGYSSILYSKIKRQKSKEEPLLEKKKHGRLKMQDFQIMACLGHFPTFKIVTKNLVGG